MISTPADDVEGGAEVEDGEVTFEIVVGGMPLDASIEAVGAMLKEVDIAVKTEVGDEMNELMLAT